MHMNIWKLLNSIRFFFYFVQRASVLVWSTFTFWVRRIVDGPNEYSWGRSSLCTMHEHYTFLTFILFVEILGVAGKSSIVESFGLKQYRREIILQVIVDCQLVKFVSNPMFEATRTAPRRCTLPTTPHLNLTIFIRFIFESWYNNTQYHNQIIVLRIVLLLNFPIFYLNRVRRWRLVATYAIACSDGYLLAWAHMFVPQLIIDYVYRVARWFSSMA